MVDILPYLPEGITSDELENIGINEKVSYKVLMPILDACGGDKEALVEELAKNADLLIPKHIVLEDILVSVNYLNSLEYGVGTLDDIDHLGNRRIRSVGELLQNQVRIGLTRMERVVKERMS